MFRTDGSPFNPFTNQISIVRLVHEHRSTNYYAVTPILPPNPRGFQGPPVPGTHNAQELAVVEVVVGADDTDVFWFQC